MSSLWRQFADPETQLQLSVAISIVALECLVAIWAARGKTHWFWRGLAVWAAIMLMVPIRAWEPAWMFGLSSPLIVVLVRGGEWIDWRFFRGSLLQSDKRPLYRFSLLDLLLLMLAVGIWLPGVLTIVRHWQPTNWLGYLATSLSVAILGVAAYWCTRMPLRWPYVGLLTLGLFEVAGAWWLEYPVLSTIAAVAGATAYLYAFDRRHWLAMLLLFAALPGCAGAMLWAGLWMRWQWVVNAQASGLFVMLMLLEGAFVVGIAAMVAVARVASRRDATTAWRISTATVGLILTAVLVVPTGKTYWRMYVRTPPEKIIPKFETAENHYDEIVELAKQVSVLDPNPITYIPLTAPDPQTGHYQREVWRATKATPELEAAYAELLRLLRAANAVQFDPQTDSNVAFDRKKGAEIQISRMLLRSLDAESKIAAQSGDYDRAADFALAMIRLGDMAGRGGVNIDMMWSQAVRRVGYQQLRPLVEHLSSHKLREAQTVIEKSLSECEDPAIQQERSRQFDEQIYGWHMRFENVARFGMSPADEAETIEMYRQLDRTISAVMQAELAIQQFQRDHGRPPTDLDELMPDYAAAPPVDPYSQPLRYGLEGDRHVVYSIGWDRHDDGGKFGTFTDYLSSMPRPPRPGWTPRRFDFDLATLTRERRLEEPVGPAPPPPSPLVDSPMTEGETAERTNEK